MLEKLDPRNWWKQKSDKNNKNQETNNSTSDDNQDKLSELIDQYPNKTDKDLQQSEEIQNITDESESNNNLTVLQPDIQKQVETILESSDLDKLRYFLKDFFRKELWEEVSVIENYNSVQVNTWLSLKQRINKDSVIVDILRGEKVNLDWRNIKIWKILLEIDDISGINLNISASSIRDNDLIKLKEILHKYLIKNSINNNEKLSSNDIADTLWLEKSNILSSESSWFIVNIDLNSDIKLSNEDISKLTITNWVSVMDKFFIQIEDSYMSENQVSLSVTQNNRDWWYFRINIWTRNKELSISVNWYSSNITREFLSGFLKGLIIKILKLQEWNENNIKKLENLWVKVTIDENLENDIDTICKQEWFIWYEDVKEEVDTKILAPWKQKEKYEKLSSEMFPNIKSIIPNYVIFEGEPGTWKTTKWKIIGRYLGYPFIYIPINSITSKWYWESESRLNEIFELSWKVWEQYWWAVVMIDEIDEIWANRDNSHEATWRVTWVLLKKLDWVEKIENILLVASTNRLEKLDPALVSRSNLNLNFRRPNKQEIKKIMIHYIWILSDIDEETIKSLEWKSWRDLSNIAKDFVSYLIKNFEEEELENKQTINNEFAKFIQKRD